VAEPEALPRIRTSLASGLGMGQVSILRTSSVPTHGISPGRTRTGDDPEATSSKLGPDKGTSRHYLSLALRGVKGQGSFTAEVQKLYIARSEAVHTAEIEQDVGMSIALQAFVHAFIVITRRLPRLNTSAQAPIKELLQS
jgi:hypothetical protein